jgi:hypothetical protein
MITMTPGISDPAKIADVDDIGLNLKTPHHDGVQQWCDLYAMQPFARPRGRVGERWRRLAAKLEKGNS